jgi:hypothetical protein
MEAAARIVRLKVKNFILNDCQTIILMVGRVSTVVVQRFCNALPPRSAPCRAVPLVPENQSHDGGGHYPQALLA